ncbi:MAG: lipid-A-disaccharide synthase [Thainema sp.]
MDMPVDILILSNGPGEVTTWVKPVVRSLRQKLGNDHQQTRISVVLSPCPNATGQEGDIARNYAEVDRVQDAKDFFPFLLFGQTQDDWDWRDRGVVIFLGGDQLFPVIIGKRLGYSTLIYGEWDTRWHRWVDQFAVMKPELIDQAKPQYRHKFTVIGDLMADVTDTPNNPSTHSPIHPSTPLPLSLTDQTELIGLLPGSKAAKLAMGVPFVCAIADQIHAARPQTRFVIPVAPTLKLEELAKFADASQNPMVQRVSGSAAQLIIPNEPDTLPYLKTESGLKIHLWTDFPAHAVLSHCKFCITTVGANTAELGALAVPMIVIIPTQQLDAMRAWDGIPGILANLPGVGTLFAKLINTVFLRNLGNRLLAWPNIWAGREIVPELIGQLQPADIAKIGINWLEHPETLAQIRNGLRQVRGESGAAHRLAELVVNEMVSPVYAGLKKKPRV